MADTPFRRKLLSLQLNPGRHKHTARTSPVACDDGPGVAGTVTEHWDGRQDATAIARVPYVAVKPQL